MLNLQMQEDEDPRVTRLLGDAQARITAIAQAHDKLWRGEMVGMVAIDELVGGIVEGLRDQAEDVTLVCDIAPLDISADTAIPIGLLVTELATNAIKYAADAGEISVALVEKDGNLVLTVTDRGPGLPPGFEYLHDARHDAR